MAQMEAMDASVRGVLAGSAVAALLVTGALTRSWLGALLCTVVLCAAIATFFGLLSMARLEIDAVDQLLMFVSGGLMIDPLAHFTNAFIDASGNRARRLEAALTRLGPSVLASGLSTVLCVVPLMGCRMVVLSKFGRMLAALLSLTLAYAP